MRADDCSSPPFSTALALSPSRVCFGPQVPSEDNDPQGGVGPLGCTGPGLPGHGGHGRWAGFLHLRYRRRPASVRHLRTRGLEPTMTATMYKSHAFSWMGNSRCVGVRYLQVADKILRSACRVGGGQLARREIRSGHLTLRSNNLAYDLRNPSRTLALHSDRQ
jgi:hypothetical protein